MTITATRYPPTDLAPARWRPARRSRATVSLHRLIGRLLFLDVAVLFAVSGGMLWMLGLNYDGVTGSMASKIHPATYLAVFCFLLLLFTRRNPVAVVTTVASRQPGAMTMLLAFAGVMIFVVAGRRPGQAGLVDTFWLPAALAIVAAQSSDREKARVEVLLHVILTVNAVMTLTEFVLQTEFFPFRLDGELLVESRPCGLQGHPLVNALITGLYATILLNGGGRALPKALRSPLILLQLAALVASGGRTALTLMAPVAGYVFFRRLLSILLGGRMSRSLVVVAFAAPVVAGVAIAGLASAGFFDVMMQRFGDDGGSAETRVQMLEIFSYIPMREIFLAPDVERIDALRHAMGLALGIENPIVRFLLYQGVIATLALLIGVTAFLREIMRSVRGNVAAPLIYFVILLNSFESVGTKSTLLAKFAILMLAMFRRED